jgi:hypothetical protein
MKLHGISEPTGPADPAVLARRKYHEAAARWFDKASTLLISAFAVVGLVLVLLPVLIDGWRAIVERTPIARTVFYEYSTFDSLAMINFFIVMFVFLVNNGLQKNLPGGIKASGLTLRQIADMELYPRTMKEEVAFCLDLVMSALSTTIPLLFFSGFVLIFLNI